MLHCSNWPLAGPRPRPPKRKLNPNNALDQELEITMATKKTTATTTPDAATDAFKQAEAAVSAGKENVDKAVKAGTEAAAKGYEQAATLTKTQVEKASKAAFKSYDQFTALNKDAIDAVFKSGSILAKGYETLGKEVMAFTQNTVDANVAATKALFGAKTLREVIDLQSDFARTSFDKTLAESAKLSELSVKVAKDAFEPIQSRVKDTVQSVMKSAA